MCGIVGYVGAPCRDLLIAGLEARVPRLRLGRDLADRRRPDRDGTCGREPDQPEARGHRGERKRRPSPWPRPSRPSGSPTRAGRPTAGSRRRTRTLTATARTASTSSSTGSSRTTPSFAASSWTRTPLQLGDRREIVAHLIERHDEGDLTEAVRAAFNELRGYAFVAMHSDRRDRRGATNARSSSGSTASPSSRPRYPPSPRPQGGAAENGSSPWTRRESRSPTTEGSP